MRFRQVLCLMMLVLLAAACGGPPSPRHPEVLLEDQQFRPLATVPKRPDVHVPLDDRQALENELRENNLIARRARRAQGYVEPTLPTEEPDMPMEIPEEDEAE